MPDQTTVMEQPKTQLRDSLDDVRASVQKLHSSINAALAKKGESAKSDIDGLKKQARQSAEQARSAMSDRYQAAQQQIEQKLLNAAEKLDKAGRHASESLDKSGKQFREKLTSALAETRSSANDISEAVAAKRSEIAAKQSKKPS